MNKILDPAHPVWCARGPDCAFGLHFSGLACAAPRGDEAVHVSAGLWRMDVGPMPSSGVLLEFSFGEDAGEHWFVDLAQSQELIRLMRTATRSAARAVPLPPMFSPDGGHRYEKEQS